MLTGVHILLTYGCTYECDHCFLHCSPRAEGTFTVAGLRSLYDQIDSCGTIDTVYFEGGEPFLYYPLMLEGIFMAHSRGIKVGIVTNGYWGTSEEDAELWLRPLVGLGIHDLSISDDKFHFGDEVSPAGRAIAAAQKLGLPVDSICIEAPTVRDEGEVGKGEPIVGGGVRFRGRAADKLTVGLPRRPCSEFTACDREELAEPGRVHIDPFGNVMVCQGISIGNVWQSELEQLMREHDPQAHPIIGPLLRGGPQALAEAYGVAHDEGYVDECHFCYDVRRKLLDRFPESLTPRQVYGVD
ncbi:radical SAM protein [candidate division GN15 bacterium]|nr:radical SAM protein [candidate division GN15 bacterium]